MLFRGIYSPSLRVWIREFLTKRRKGNKKRKGNLKIPVQRPCDRYGMGALENNRSSRVERIQGSKKNKNKEQEQEQEGNMYVRASREGRNNPGGYRRYRTRKKGAA
ncbi:hypothetical protein TWF103_008614 [Orbilia oligospora]|nr:hypothetical protein TWF103_008614 [Orbilia oligospora]KAF3099809.1 hypothetical protein TWF103_008614 [Orbilia oligospora]